MIFLSLVLQIKGIEYLPSIDSRDSVVIATRDKVHIKQPTSRQDLTIIDHVIGGKITCLDCDADIIAVGVGPYGFGILGNTVCIHLYNKCFWEPNKIDDNSFQDKESVKWAFFSKAWFSLLKAVTRMSTSTCKTKSSVLLHMR